MWIYQKKLEYPVNITSPDARMAKALFAQYGGPDSELAAGMRYLTQRYSMPDDRCRATLNDIGTEELAPRGYRQLHLFFRTIVFLHAISVSCTRCLRPKNSRPRAHKGSNIRAAL